MSPDALLQRIEAAFPSAGLGSGISLRQALFDDNAPWDGNDPAARVAAYLADVTTDWRAVPDADLEYAFERFSLFGYLDTAGYRYYLPAAMHRAVREPLSICAYKLLFELEFSARGWLEHGQPADHSQRSAGLDHAQRSAVAAFIQWALENNDDTYMPSGPDAIAALGALQRALLET
jgi:hypothetical protein